MNFQQLRSVREAVRCGFNLTEVAKVLHTSQPGVSRQIRELEEELGVDLFVRAGKRLTSLTEVGTLIVPIVENMLNDADNLRRAGEEFTKQANGRLSIAATHSQARYALPGAVRDFRQRYPNVTLNLHQGSPEQVAEMLISGEADIGIATEALNKFDNLVALPCYRWTHSVIVPPDHPLLDGQPLTLERLASFPIITYNAGYTGRMHIDEAFEAAGLSLDLVLTAMDADVIKTYVELGLGVGIVASIAFDEERDRSLRAIDAGHLFSINLTKLAVRRGSFLRSYVYDFIETFASTLTHDVVQKAMATRPGERIEL
ncbi:CysB family HTH-type transcriptional regulator [Piscinibacter gummiphilus]|uniref:Transcriptional regulator n=1 Tax=Piscinibacter gummiphilus TaxID=946333 RepID=A0A1W6L7Y3_9BURK|nr:CysB family HTH-type transcriptional regulator [Piscinibacter gummiphilus]ARN20316.1 transcriptional regulator [Piscinibacter gummiphilus]ATU64987.1 CysB family HTH-type transcriptional regulator [Piscinibacter gummiphilus]GLS96374.1 CysB family transcriptional regulator [Piscinibacter gummiphilus]